MIGVSHMPKITVRAPKSGSTAPVRQLRKKAFFADIPSWRKGSEIAAPSGKFWIPMPTASAVAEAIIAGSLPCWAAKTKERPIAIPSGILCKVTAAINNFVRFETEDEAVAELEPEPDPDPEPKPELEPEPSKVTEKG